MSSNNNKNSKLNFKSSLPSAVGDFWIKLSDTATKEIVRGLTRVSTLSGEIDFSSIVANKLTTDRFSLTGPISLKYEPEKVIPMGIHNPRYNTVDAVATEPGLNRGLLNNTGVYGLDLETYRLWEDPNGLLWIFNTEEESFTPTSNSILNIPKYAISVGDIYPVLILSNNGYLSIGVDFELVGGNVLFYDDPDDLFSGYIHIVEGYANKVTLFGFPYSVDSDCYGVDHIANYLRGHNSIKNLEKALSQVVGYDTFNYANSIYIGAVPGGTSLIDTSGKVSIVPQDIDQSGKGLFGTFPGEPVSILSGEQCLSVFSHQLELPLRYALGDLILYDKTYVCTIQDDFVHIDYGDANANEYLNTARKNFESLPREDTAGFPISTLSEYLISKYAPGALNGDVFLVNILQEYFTFYKDNILIIRLKNYLTDSQKSRALDFLQTHTPSNAIIFVDSTWE